MSCGISKYENINGVTCYMNSILSILQQTQLCDFIISNYFREVIKKKYKKEEVMDLISYQIFNIFKISLKNDFNSIRPTTLRQKLGDKNEIWSSNQQQDSQEFFTFLISTLEDELKNSVKFIGGSNICKQLNFKNNSQILLNIMAQKRWEQFVKKEYSPIKILFTGLLINSIECEYCKYKSYNFETFTSLQLPLPVNSLNSNEYNLEECLKLFLTREKLDNKNKKKCECCKRTNCVTKEIKIWRSPKILVLNLKRFLTNNYGFVVKKINNSIKYPMKLDLSEHIYENKIELDNYNYKLLGINLHFDIDNCNFGHYISIVKNRLDGKWYKFDDSRDEELEWMEELQNSKAYLLFYHK